MLAKMHDFLSPIFLCSLFAFSLAALRNVTVDDANGDEISGAMPTYLPNGDWALGSNCKGCSAQPNASFAFDGTWHDTTHSAGHLDQRSVTIKFGGTAVYAYFITANNFSYTTLTNLTFTIDGDLVGNFLHEPGPNADFDYNVLGYSNITLPNTIHEFVISTTGDESLMLFDYITYTFDTAEVPVNTFTSSPPIPTLSIPTETAQQPQASSSVHQSATSKRISTGVIVGTILAGLTILIGVFILFLYVRRRKSRRNSSRRWQIEQDGSSNTLVAPVQVPEERVGHTMQTEQEIREGTFGVPAISEKRTLLRMEEIQRQIDALRSRVVRLDATEEVAMSFSTIRPTDSASNTRPLPLVNTQMRDQLIELQSQMTALQAQQEGEVGKITQ